MTIPVDERRHYTRAEAIQLLIQLQESQFDDDYDDEDPTTLNNEQLEEELCLSGVVHDSDMLGVVD